LELNKTNLSRLDDNQTAKNVKIPLNQALVEETAKEFNSNDV